MIALFTPAAETVAARVVILCVACWILSGFLVTALCWIDARDLRRLAREADDHNEPSREQVEWDAHVAEAIELTQSDIDAIVAWDDLEFAASVMADIDDLPGGAA